MNTSISSDIHSAIHCAIKTSTKQLRKENFIQACLDSGILKFNSNIWESGVEYPYSFDYFRISYGLDSIRIGECYADIYIENNLNPTLLYSSLRNQVLANLVSCAIYRRLSSKFNNELCKKNVQYTTTEHVHLKVASLYGDVLIVDSKVSDNSINLCLNSIRLQSDTKLVGILVGLDTQEKSSEDQCLTKAEYLSKTGIPVYSIINFMDLFYFVQEFYPTFMYKFEKFKNENVLLDNTSSIHNEEN